MQSIPERFRFGGGATAMVLSPAAAAAMVLAIVLILGCREDTPLSAHLI